MEAWCRVALFPSCFMENVLRVGFRLRKSKDAGKKKGAGRIILNIVRYIILSRKLGHSPCCFFGLGLRIQGYFTYPAHLGMNFLFVCFCLAFY